ncbi:MAG: MFS transporter [Erysipelothrix sp.]
MKRFSDRTVVVLFLIYGFEAVAANLAHPITPNLIAYRNMPNYMFGVVFAAMSLTNFLLSPFWGNLCNHIESRKLLLISGIGYAVGQGLFGVATNPFVMTLARFISGLFVSCMSIAATYYVIQHSPQEERSRNLTITITTFTVMGTFGYFLGGYLGNINIFIPFVLQCLLLSLSGVLYYIFLKPNPVIKLENFDDVLKKSNPVQSFIQIKPSLNPLIISLFTTVLLASLASTSFTQNYAYYLQNTLGMSPLINGITKGLVGLFATIFNFTVTLWILRQKNVEKHLSYLFALLSSMLMVIGIFKENVFVFIIFGIVVMVLDTVQVSVLQDRNASYANAENQGVMLGMHNAMKALGMIGGSLISGFIYDLNPLYPFVFALVLYLIAMVSAGVLSKRRTT